MFFEKIIKKFLIFLFGNFVTVQASLRLNGYEILCLNINENLHRSFPVGINILVSL